MCLKSVESASGQAEAEYRAAVERGAWFERDGRGLICVSGSERQTWLHNLVTNDIRGLKEGRGCYAFALDVRGRILFDMDVLALNDALWLDLDAAYVEMALRHFDRYLITEDARPEDRSGAYTRMGCVGPRAGEIARKFGAEAFEAMGASSVVTLGNEAWLVRCDLGQVPGFELIVAREHVEEWRGRLAASGAARISDATLEVLRIEAGLLRAGHELDGSALPAETGQLKRAVSFKKGCYLGQEIVERMRSHGSVARRLVRVELEQGEGMELPACLRQESEEVGRIMSLARHPISGRWIGLGYLKTRVTRMEAIAAGEQAQPVDIAELA